MEIEFSHDGVCGLVSVSCGANDDPVSVAKGEDARGFAMCTATIDFPGQGYRSLFGWVQLVCSTDDAVGGAFEMDPARFFEDSPAPYCWWGFAPTLFDAPSRAERKPMEWLAHSFLAITPRDAGARKPVVPLLGFSWGFAIDALKQITLTPPARLRASDWTAHLPLLRASYPTWEFPPPATLA